MQGWNKRQWKPNEFERWHPKLTNWMSDTRSDQAKCRWTKNQWAQWKNPQANEQHIKMITISDSSNWSWLNRMQTLPVLPTVAVAQRQPIGERQMLTEAYGRNAPAFRRFLDRKVMGKRNPNQGLPFDGVFEFGRQPDWPGQTRQGPRRYRRETPLGLKPMPWVQQAYTLSTSSMSCDDHQVHGNWDRSTAIFRLLSFLLPVSMWDTITILQYTPSSSIKRRWRLIAFTWISGKSPANVTLSGGSKPRSTSRTWWKSYPITGHFQFPHQDNESRSCSRWCWLTQMYPLALRGRCVSDTPTLGCGLGWTLTPRGGWKNF